MLLSAKATFKSQCLIFNTNGGKLRLQTPAGFFSRDPDPTEVNVIMQMTEV